MSAYGALARWYDRFTQDVPYGAFAAFYETALHREGKEHLTLLDLCCGTGTLTLLLAQRGHELIGVDASPEMLACAQEKCAAAPLRCAPLFLCQSAGALDLYGTVEGAYCALDGMNYLPPEEVAALFARLHLFLEPGGKFIFDLHAPAHLRALDGCCFADESEDALVLWRGEFDAAENALVYGMDIFSRAGALWRRDAEEHVEYAHAPRALLSLLRKSGFAKAELLPGGPLAEEGRLFICAENGAH